MICNTDKHMITRGDTPTINHKIVRVTLDDNGDILTSTPFDLTGYSVYLTCKKNKKDPDNEALINATGVVATPTNGEVAFNLTTTQTNIQPGRYPFDITIRKTVSGVVTNLTVYNDYLRIVQDVRHD